MAGPVASDGGAPARRPRPFPSPQPLDSRAEMKARLTLLTPLALTLCLVLAGPALGNPNGEGIVGETDDKMITFFSLGVVVFFTVFVALMSWLQSALEKRKEQRKGSTHVRDVVGW